MGIQTPPTPKRSLTALGGGKSPLGGGSDMFLRGQGLSYKLSVEDFPQESSSVVPGATKGKGQQIINMLAQGAVGGDPWEGPLWQYRS